MNEWAEFEAKCEFCGKTIEREWAYTVSNKFICDTCFYEVDLNEDDIQSLECVWNG